MIVSDIMKTQVITISPEETIRSAMLLLLQHRFRHLPVINSERRLVGIVSDRDLRLALPSKLKVDEEDIEILNTPVSSIMTEDVISCHPLDFVDEVASTLYEKRISSLPVLQNGELVGIVTETDILHTLVQLMGVKQPSSKIIVEVPDQSGVLADVASVFKETKINVSSVLVYSDRVTNSKRLDFRVHTIDPRKPIQLLLQHGYKVVWPTILGDDDEE